ncbi:MAG: hypothetical protein DRP68_00295 [Candidatus Omnitrophota bacterium]|nr:MAG: hypothetical protein DRP68_00295 [Candidatus Omnitrophota bacterium]
MRVLAFDLGNVVFNFDYHLALEKIKTKLGSSPQRVIDALFYENFAQDFEKGLVSGYDFYQKFKKEFNCSLDYEEFKDIWCKIFFPNQEVISFIKILRLIYPIYLISNINELHFNYLYQSFGEIFSLFDGSVFSFQVKSVKPEERIYEELVKLTGVSKDRIIYIDDRQDLVDEAQLLGFSAIRFTTFSKLIDQLQEKGVFVPTFYEGEVLLKLKDKLSVTKNAVIVGLGNPLRGDDGIGSILAGDLKGKLLLRVLDVGLSLENYLTKLMEYKFILIVDSAHFSSSSRFELFSLHQLGSLSLDFTHALPLDFLMKCLKKDSLTDILILGIKPYNLKVGEELSIEVRKVREGLGNFFIRNFSLKKHASKLK